MPKLPKLRSKMIYESQQSIESKISKMWTDYRHLKLSPPEERSQNLRIFQQVLNSEKSLLSELISAEMGKPRAQADSEIQRCIQHIDYYANFVGKLGPSRQDGPLSKTKQVNLWRGKGVVYKICPFNFPLWQGLKVVIPNLAMGNSVLVRPPETCVKMAEALEAGLKGEGVMGFDFVYNSVESTEGIISDRRVKGCYYYIVWCHAVIRIYGDTERYLNIYIKYK